MPQSRIHRPRRAHVFSDEQLEGLGVWCVLTHTDPADVETYLDGDDLVAQCQETGRELVITYDAKASVI